MRILPTLSTILLLLALAACAPGTVTSPGPAEPTSLFGPGNAAATATPAGLVEPGTTPIEPAPAEAAFSVAAIIDTTTDQVTVEQAQAAIDQASKLLREFSPYGFVLLDYEQDGSGGSSADLAARYIAAHAGVLPSGLVIFSAGDGGQARLSGGYGFSLPPPAGFHNLFVSPVTGQAGLFVAVVDYAYKYMACGYGGAQQSTSATSLAGECRGQTGIPCVSHNGYSMCSNAVGNLYTQNPTYAISSMIVHGMLHNFGPNGDADHYATDQCNARMGYPAGFFDLQESEYYNGLCPYVYEDFNNSYK